MTSLPRRKGRKLPSAVLEGHLTKKRYFKIKFIKMLQLQDGMFASDFVKMTKEKDNAGMSLSESAVYNYLKKFQEEGIIYHDKTTRKYYLTQDTKIRFAVEEMTADLKNLPESMLDLGQEILEAANQQIRKESLRRSEILINLWGRWISAIALYCLGKEIETGQPFWFILAHYLTYVGGPRAFIKRHIIYQATPDLDLKELIQLFRKDVALGEQEAYAETIASYFEDLKSIYPKEIETLERIFQNEGKQK